MPTASECIKALENAAGGDLSDDEIMALLEELDRIRTERRAEAGLEDVEAEMFDAAQQLVADMALAARVEKRNRLKNLIVRSRILRMADEANAKFGDASLALESVLGGINSRLDAGRFSADTRGKSIMSHWLGGMVADLRKEGLHGVYARGTHDRDVARELWDMSLKNPTGAATKNSDAKKIARIIDKYKRAAVHRENRAGAFIRLREGHVTRQTHNRMNMRRAGQKEWADQVRGRLDWDAMGVPTKDRESFLKSAYEALVTGVRKEALGADESDLLFAFKGPGNLAKRDSARRVLLFKSADDWFDYNEKFGYGNVRETLQNDFQRAAMNTALMETLGTNPEAMLTRVRHDLSKKFRSDPRQVERLQRKTIDNLMAEVDGSVNHSDSLGVANVSRIIRAVQSMAKLGGAFISAFADLAATAAERRFQGRNWASAWGDAFQAMVSVVPPAEHRRLGELLGVGIDGITGDFTSRFSAQDDVPGRTSKLMRLYFKLNLLGPWTDGIKRGVGLMMSRDLAMWADNAFDSLPERVQTNLRHYGMDGKKWEIARQALHNAEDGRSYMLPSLVDDLNIPQKQKDDVREILFSYITDRVEFASPTPGARERAIMRRGARPGTAEGEALRFIMQFKAFPITVTTRVLGRDLFSGNAKNLSDAILKGEGDLMGIANFIAGGTVLGMMSLQAKELAKGRELRPWEDPSTIMAGALQGGGLGIYGDFLFGETNRFGRSPLATAAGPFLGTVEDLIQIKDAAMAGEDIWAETINLVKSNVPGGNLFYIKTALDYMVWYQLQEWSNPGYLRRMERRIKKENDQRFWLAPPSQAIPFGGGGGFASGLR